jgi:hypothetical protein
MHLTGTRISGERASTRGLVPALLVLFLLVGGLPCGSLTGCCCPCSSQDLPSSRVEAPGSCCDGSTDAALTLAPPAKPQQALAAPLVLPAESQNLAPTFFPPAMPRFSRAAVRSYYSPPLIFLLCTLLI